LHADVRFKDLIEQLKQRDVLTTKTN